MQTKDKLIIQDSKGKHEWNMNNHNANQRLKWLPSPGNIIFTLLTIGLLILTQRVWATPTQNTDAPGPSATTINYQGNLTGANGNPKNGSFDMSFSLWDAASGGAKKWGAENHAGVPVNNGIFNVGLGSKTSGGIPTTVWNGDRYLEITVGDETLTPRELLRSVPIAGMALTALDANSSAFSTTAIGQETATTELDSFSLLPDMSISFELDEPHHVVAIFSGAATNLSETGSSVIFRLLVDGIPKAQVAPHISVAGSSIPIVIHWGETLPVGSHTVEVQWRTKGVGTARMLALKGNQPWEQRVLSITATKD